MELPPLVHEQTNHTPFTQLHHHCIDDTNLIVLASVNVMGISMVSVHGGLPPSAACIVSVSVVFILSAVISLIKLISPVEREVQNINMTNLMLSNRNDTYVKEWYEALLYKGTCAA